MQCNTTQLLLYHEDIKFLYIFINMENILLSKLSQGKKGIQLYLGILKKDSVVIISNDNRNGGQKDQSMVGSLLLTVGECYLERKGLDITVTLIVGNDFWIRIY